MAEIEEADPPQREMKQDSGVISTSQDSKSAADPCASEARNSQDPKILPLHMAREPEHFHSLFLIKRIPC